MCAAVADLTFVAEVHHRGRSVTLLWVPEDVAGRLGGGVRVPVRGEVDGRPYAGWARRLRDCGPWYLLVSGDLRQRDTVPVEIERDPSPEPTGLPDDMADLLAGFPKAQKGWDDLSPTHRAEYLEWIDEAPTPATRTRRIMASIDKLRSDEP
jgi:Bacteriocin-protection, YdeI or OmpD-Associated/Domain of unknown function (DUF1905)